MAFIQESDWDSSELRRRGMALAIALVLEALLILAILSLSMQSAGTGKGKRGLSTFSLAAESASEKSDESKRDAETPVTKKQERNIVPPIPKPLLPPVNRVKAPPPSPDFIRLSKSEFDATDLSKIPATGGAGSGEAKGAGQGNNGMIGPGAGPGGAQLYPVAWYREPFDSELAPYLADVKRIPPGASAEIACRMIENFHVENCQILGESPRGTGLAHALRKAAWQFLVRPPRIDNKPLLGVWVRIRFDFGVKEVVGDGSP